MTVATDPSFIFRSNEVSRTATITPDVEIEGRLGILLPHPHESEPLADPDPLLEPLALLILLKTLFPFTTDEKLNGKRAVTEPVKAGLTPAPYA